jgi:hypothetical protein
MIAPDTITNTLERAAWERGHSEAMAHDKIPDSRVGTPPCIAAKYFVGWHQGREDKLAGRYK